MKRPPHLGMHHVALHVDDMAAARRFYVDILGYTVEWEPDPDNLYLTMGTDNLALHKGDAGGKAQRLDHIGLVVAESAHVAAWETYLRGHQVEILAATRHHRDGATSCYVRDFCGAALQIIHHPPISPRLAAPSADSVLAQVRHDLRTLATLLISLRTGLASVAGLDPDIPLLCDGAVTRLQSIVDQCDPATEQGYKSTAARSNSVTPSGA